MSDENTEQKFILTRTMHLGFLKESFSKGTVFTVDKPKRMVYIEATGQTYKDLRDIDICVRNGFLVSYSEEAEAELEDMPDVSAPRGNPHTKPAPAMKVVKSDRDLVEDIDISHTKTKEAAEREASDTTSIIREQEGEEVRGLRVLRSIPDVEDYQEVAIVPSVTTKSTESKAKAASAKKTTAAKPSKAASKKATQAKGARKSQAAKARAAAKTKAPAKDK